MKTQNLLMAAYCILISVSCGPRTDKEYLSDVLQKMNKVESVSYKVVRQAWLPGEKDPVYTITSEVYEHINPQDTAIGSSFVEFQDNAFLGVYFYVKVTLIFLNLMGKNGFGKMILQLKARFLSVWLCLNSFTILSQFLNTQLLPRTL